MSANFAYQNTRDFEFILQEWLPTEEIFNYRKFAGYYSKNEVKAFLAPILRMSKEVVEPTNTDGEKNPVRFENGQVKTPPSFGPLFAKLQQEGWGTSNIDASEDALVMPHILYAMVWEMFNAANPTFAPYIILTSGAAGLIQSFGTQRVKEMFLPRMMNGEWSGTMCLTEPSAGSDVGDILSRAYPTEHPEIFKIKGQKIFITGGDNDFTENIVHLYLARVEGARPGTAGISLFVVPKYWVDEDGSLTDNDVQTTGVEHKLGQAGSVTAALSFGENNGCRGWLLGPNPLENEGRGQGMAQMFQMMNMARLETGHLALSCIANAFYNARDYCKERIQGRLLTDPKAGRVPIIKHEDIKRTLLMGKAHVEVMRAMLYKTYFAFDVRSHDPDPLKRQQANDLIEVATPLCKAYPSDEGWWLCGEAIQAYGGYGYCEEYPVAQIARDIKIYSIWEGANYIQGLDLVGRKMTMKKGSVFAAFIQDIEEFCAAHRGEGILAREFAHLDKALSAYRQIQKTLLGFAARQNMDLVAVYARRVLTATAQLYGGRLILDQAWLAQKRLGELEADHYDRAFYQGKVDAARYYLLNVVPNVWLTAEVLASEDSSAVDIPSESFDY